MVLDVLGVEVRTTVVGRASLVTDRSFVTGAHAHVGVVEVQAAHLIMVASGLVYVRGAGQEAER